MKVFENRINTLRQLMAEQHLRQVAVNAGKELGYLIGLSFHISERPVICIIPLDRKPVIFYPEFEAGKVAATSMDIFQFPYPEDAELWVPILKKALQKAGFEKSCVAIPPQSFRFLEMQLMQAAVPDLQFASALDIFKSMRVIKDAQEQKAIRSAVHLAEEAFRLTLSHIKAGISEKEIANRLFINILMQGSDTDLPFQPIVASGPNSADPHAVPGSRTLQVGDLVILDWGACCDGYISDITRTVNLGPPNQQAIKIAEAVFASNQAARKQVAPGTRANQVDTTARNVISEAGFGSFFTHRTGHGIGIEAHEEPYISSADTTILSPGMTFTIEPGIYLPDWGGVRIEDNILVNEQGAETLTTLPRDLVVLTE